MDPDIARWLLDFLVRQPISDSTLATLLDTLPISDTDSTLKKLLLLRIIESDISNGSVPNDLLSILEHMEEQDYREKVEISDSMKRAYCFEAVHCTVKFLNENDVGKYFEAVKKIWRDRVGRMEKYGNVGLVSDELISWKDDIETALWNDNVRMGLLEKWKGVDVVEAVRVFVKEAKEKIGPSFLELAAETLSADTLKKVSEMETQGVQKGTVQRRSKARAAKQNKKFNSRTSRRGVKIVDNEEMSDASPHNNYGCPSTPDITKLLVNLRSSTSGLHKVVKDPLPDALEMAKNVASNMDSVGKSTDVMHAEKSNFEIKGSTHRTDATKVSLMERNNTVRTCEWDKSIDGSADLVSRLHLSSPKERVVSPLKKHKPSKPYKGKRKLWSNLEEDTLRTGVQKYGIGKWKFILNMYKDVFDGRTEVNLKDKWRNMTKYVQ